MSDASQNLELLDERTAQKRYVKKVQAKASQPVTIAVPRNNQFTGTGLPQARAIPNGELVGRIALTKSHPLLNHRNDFYIGETYCSDLDGVEVFSWAAPVSCTFFRGGDHHEFCDDVAVIRSFLHAAGQIHDFTDETLQHGGLVEPFRKRGLSVPAAPTRPGAGRLLLPGRATSEPVEAGRPSSNHAHPPRTGLNADDPSSSGTLTGATHLPSVRAEALLRERLLAPRTKRLSSVLSTLQPDQYELVTISARESAIVEGQPGTGKTIVAAHRAAFFVDDQAPAEKALRTGTVLMVGPTAGYTNHVRDLIARLTGGSQRIEVLSLPELLLQILGTAAEPKGPASKTWRDVDVELCQIVRRAIHRIKVPGGTAPKVEAVYELLRKGGTSDRPLSQDAEWISYLRRLPLYKDALALRAHSSLLAFIHWETGKRPRNLGDIKHILVDEAQDVTPLEWFLLQAINRTNSWTLLGDLNQRRSDHTLTHWSGILDVLALSSDDAPIRRLERGYRSTKPILEFANRLLPRSERKLLAFQTEGPQPDLVRARPREVADRVVEQVERLIAAHPAGTVAVISVDSSVAATGLRSANWSVVRGDWQVWTKSGKQVRVLPPDDARGLEFDAVVVVEPADFPKNLGRQGPLYTALTRPNRELSIVHSKPLPDALKRR